MSSNDNNNMLYETDRSNSWLYNTGKIKLIKISLWRFYLQRKDLSDTSALWRLKRNSICYSTAIYRQVYTHVSEHKKINDVPREWNALADRSLDRIFDRGKKKTFSHDGESGDDEESHAFDAEDAKTKRRKESGPPVLFFFHRLTMRTIVLATMDNLLFMPLTSRPCRPPCDHYIEELIASLFSRS